MPPRGRLGQTEGELSRCIFYLDRVPFCESSLFLLHDCDTDLDSQRNTVEACGISLLHCDEQSHKHGQVAFVSFRYTEQPPLLITHLFLDIFQLSHRSNFECHYSMKSVRTHENIPSHGAAVSFFHMIGTN
jgi:hypothetical protein